MAHRIQKVSHFGENNGIERHPKGKMIHETRLTRATLGQIENSIAAGVNENFRTGKDAVKPRGVVFSKPVVQKNFSEQALSENECRPRTFSIEPMDVSMVLSKVPQDMRDVIDIDADDVDNAFSCAEYANEIYNYLRKREEIFQVPTNYIQGQTQINARMRAILVDWLVQVHDKFRLLQETLFLTVSFLDRYLSIDNKVDKANLQLVGVTAMFLASKIEEMYTPEVNDFVYITDNAYSASMIRSLETKMAKLLGYNFGDPLCIHFLRRNSKAAKVQLAENHKVSMRELLEE